MSLKILFPDGKLDIVCGISAVKEETVCLNGKKKLISVDAENLDEEVSGLRFHTGLPEERIGNLSAEKVREILNGLLENGYYDLSGLGLKTAHSEKEILKMNGEPYFLKEKMNLPGNMCMGGIFSDSMLEDGDGWEDDDSDEEQGEV